MMAWLNYHHLLYFWMIAREGGMGPAAQKLRLAVPTLSSQVKKLEEQFGEKLFEKRGRKLALTPVGQTVFEYAEQIFALGAELSAAVRDGVGSRLTKLVVGVSDAVPKLIVRELLKPALAAIPNLRLSCREGSMDRMLAEIALHSLDGMITDAPAPAGTATRVYSHLLGESAVSVFGARALAQRFAKNFPQSLNGAPFLLPSEATSVRRALDVWFQRNEIVPKVIADFDDTALMKAFGQDGIGLFVSPSAIASSIEKQYDAAEIGKLENVREQFYILSSERKITHPAIIALHTAARRELF